MRVQHFYEMWEADSDGAFPIKQFAGLPEFCTLILKDGNAAFLTYIDGWEVQPTGDTVADLETGRKYAEMTVAYARKTRSPAFITFVFDSIQFKTAIDGVKAVSAIEYGFFQRIAQIAFCGSMN
jgi:hypothetical protein